MLQPLGGVNVLDEGFASRADIAFAHPVLRHAFHLDELAILDVGIYAAAVDAKYAIGLHYFL